MALVRQTTEPDLMQAAALKVIPTIIIIVRLIHEAELGPRRRTLMRWAFVDSCDVISCWTTLLFDSICIKFPKEDGNCEFLGAYGSVTLLKLREFTFK